MNAQIKDMLELAKSGKVSGIPFAAKTGHSDEVAQAWGKAENKDAIGSDIYETFAKKNAVIGYNKGSQIIDVRSTDPKLHTITLSQIEQALGKPTDTKVNGDDTIYIYKASDVFQLKFIIPKSTGKVDHISVFDAKDAVNNMAG
ncbi:YjgB family protein [Paenibacillus aestuarii]|uniref:YjgB family protein n=1 Tax=Paenibacillus aestuarii TaxID=516965 RepID=A0ABW0K9C8_9BACL|nr:YjgB family protein [Paenibacillus aestuarii]